MRTFWLSGLLAMVVLAAAVPLPSRAQAFPSKPIRLVVPTTPGPGMDQVARLAAPRMSQELGQPIVVENRAGAAGIIGSEVVARSPADGYTMLLATPSMIITPVYLLKKLPYDPVKDFTAIANGVEPVTALVVHPSVPAGNVKEFIDWLKRNPGKVSYGSSGVGSVFHMVGEMFNQAAGVHMTHVPYKGIVPAMSDLVAGQIQVTFIAMSNALPQARGGKAKILAVLEGARFSRLPDIPTVGESLPGFEKPASWFGYLGPGGMPQAVVRRLNAAIVKSLTAPEVRNALEDAAFAVIASTPEQYAAMIKQGFETYGRAIKIAGLKPEE